jgi:hypothetical protein
VFDTTVTEITSVDETVDAVPAVAELRSVIVAVPAVTPVSEHEC